MTGSAKGTKLAQNTPYHKIVNIQFCVQHLLPISWKTFPIKFFIDGKYFTSVA